MRVLTVLELAQEAAKLLNKPILYIGGVDFWQEDDLSTYGVSITVGKEQHPTIDCEGRVLAAPYLNILDHSQIFADGNGFIICKDENELYHYYDLTYGDDGLTENGRKAREKDGYPIYEGPHKIYALTINEKGELGSENT